MCEQSCRQAPGPWQLPEGCPKHEEGRERAGERGEGGLTRWDALKRLALIWGEIADSLAAPGTSSLANDSARSLHCPSE